MRIRFRPLSPRLLAPLGIFVAASCSDDLVAPTAGRIEVTTSTSGPEPDLDGYSISADGGAAQPIGVNANLTVSGLNPGSHQVALGGLAANCAVTGDNPRSTNVPAGGTAELIFAITCSTATGSIEVTTATTGGEPDDGYTVAVDDGTAQPIGANEKLTVSNVTPGAHEVTLAGVATNCSVSGGNPRSVTVTAGATAEVSFAIVCPAAAPHASRISWAKGRLDATENAQFDIYVMNADGSGQSRLTNTPATQFHHQWSPDGRKMLFVRGDIYVINSNGSGETRLPTASGGGSYPQWSPDGNRIAYMGDLGIYVMNSDGNGQVKVTEGSSYEPRWSPDGGRILFVRPFSDGTEALSHIYVVNSDGSGESRLTNIAVDGQRDLNRFAVWSPNGEKIAFAREGPNDADIYVINADGSGLNNLTNSPQRKEITPFWAPDGRTIVFAAQGDMTTNADVMAMNADGSGERNLTNSPWADEPWFTWSTDGAKITFTRRAEPTLSGEIWVMNADGGNQLQLTHTPDSEDDFNPIWQP